MELKTSVSLAGVELKNPVMVASGTFGSGEEYSEFVDLNQLGAVVTKGVANVPWPGNPTPRIAETHGGMLNAIGLQNPGMEVFIKRDLPFLQKFDTKAVEAITKAVKAKAKQPVIMKLSPNVTDITVMAKAAEAGGADVLSLINTLTGMKIDIERQCFAIANKTGGMSGPAVKPVALRMVYQAANAVQIPIIGMGGIANADDAMEFILAGATAVSIGTANFYNPYATVETVKGIEDYMRRHHCSDINDLVGIVK